MNITNDNQSPPEKIYVSVSMKTKTIIIDANAPVEVYQAIVNTFKEVFEDFQIIRKSS